MPEQVYHMVREKDTLTAISPRLHKIQDTLALKTQLATKSKKLGPLRKKQAI